MSSPSHTQSSVASTVFAVGLGVGVAAVAGVAVGAMFGASALSIAAASKQQARPPLTAKDLRRDEEGRILNWRSALRIIQQGGISPELRGTLWPFLLGVFSPDSTEQARARELARLRGVYAQLLRAARAAVAFGEAHRIIVMDGLRTDLRGGEDRGVDPGAGLSPRHWDSRAARDALAAMPEGAAHAPRTLRLIRLLSAYSVHDPETGYCQGMSDLAAVVVMLVPDEALAFACFERVMRHARRNFRHDETGIKHQLLQLAHILSDTDPPLYARLRALDSGDCMFAYRMVVVMLRRELPLPRVLLVWEAAWAHAAAAGRGDGVPTGSAAAYAGGTSIPPPDFVLQFIAAVVRGQRRQVMSCCHGTDDVLRLFSGVQIDFWLSLAQAQKQYKAYSQGGRVPRAGAQ
ncbi:TBC1 domain family member 15 [Auxenochlorella protothecoides]|uniref:TBC1 domain family member 15 n=1 Tax=Auxenochlorella protothecoides TaxID=3075 RepID=A0A087SDW6_AUXPR|nr:TBC1 domain family member 15 [Auxenochlorella protothecoides]KFM23920.1 TBC1 domain family member 15 [Auxenochlorella protothecoides]